MSVLNAGWFNRVIEYLKLQVEPTTIKKVAAEALGLDPSVTLTKGEYDTLSRVVASAGWRAQKFWIPPAAEGPWSGSAAR